MNKMKLNLDQLKVESFSTKETKKSQGTVKGNIDLSDQYWCDEEGTRHTACNSWCATCAPSCEPNGYTCDCTNDCEPAL